MAARAIAAAAACATVLATARPAAAAPLASATWSASNSQAGAAGTSYAYALTTATSASLSSVTVTVPTGTGGIPSVAAVSPGSLAGGSVTLAGTTLTYSFATAQVSARTAISIRISGLTNTAAAGAYTAQVSTGSGAGTVDTGTTGSFTFTATALANPAWSSSPASVGTSGASYAYAFTTASTALITSVTMTVPPGTAGSPALGTVTPSALAGGTVTLSGTTLTYSGLSLTLTAGTAVSIQITGLTNTATAGSYAAEIVTQTATLPVDSGVTPAVSLTGPLALTSPVSLGWTATLDGGDLTVPDTAAADQRLTVSDQTGTGAGWHVTVAATTFANGAYTLPAADTLELTGSTSAATTGSAPSASCATSCVPPDDTVTYPVTITTATSSPPPADIYRATADSGLGVVTIGVPSPAGWWVTIPGDARAGSYISTLTVTVVSGP